MVSSYDLKKINLLQNLSDEALEKILPITKHREFKEGEMIFKQGDPADALYLLKRGKVLLEVDLSEIVSISLGSVKTGFSFGWSALMGDSNYTSHAICSEPCEILSVSGKELQSLLEQDHAIGYHIMIGVAQIIKNRLARRTDQFLKVMSKHPDIQKLL
ncbi:MAG: cyclic nucleotide-binding domain-containing protein [Deltaproteobacteria bacterium]|nr:cyclic nucleotide-binding domain-containing protein [Deltaproteobacteria bacterium]